jgi:hypothetical protein
MLNEGNQINYGSGSDFFTSCVSGSSSSSNSQKVPVSVPQRWKKPYIFNAGGHMACQVT